MSKANRKYKATVIYVTFASIKDAQQEDHSSNTTGRTDAHAAATHGRKPGILLETANHPTYTPGAAVVAANTGLGTIADAYADARPAVAALSARVFINCLCCWCWGDTGEAPPLFPPPPPVAESERCSSALGERAALPPPLLLLAGQDREGPPPDTESIFAPPSEAGSSLARNTNIAAPAIIRPPNTPPAATPASPAGVVSGPDGGGGSGAGAAGMGVLLRLVEGVIDGVMDGDTLLLGVFEEVALGWANTKVQRGAPPIHVADRRVTQPSTHQREDTANMGN